eukprot:scaffold105511_cov93-Phaeocystis_antarctica.AAC.5
MSLDLTLVVLTFQPPPSMAAARLERGLRRRRNTHRHLARKRLSFAVRCAKVWMALARDAQHILSVGEPLAGGGDKEVFAAFAVELEQPEWQGRVHALQEGRQVYGLHLTRRPFLAGATWCGAALCREVDRRIL